MATAPNPREIATLVSDLLKHGDQEKVADALHITPSNLSRRLNPLDVNRLGLYEGLRELWAIAEVNPDAFSGLRVYVETLFDSWQKPATAIAPLPLLVIAADKEADDVIRSFVAGKPAHEQLAEVTQAITALRRVADALGQSGQLREAGK